MAEFSAAIIGAGPAGLAAALTLSRALQPTIVFDLALATEFGISRLRRSPRPRTGIAEGFVRHRPRGN